MALLFEIAGYSLHQLILGPEEKVYTSMARSWGAPSANPTAKEWIMDITIRKNPNSMNSITFTLYNLRMSGNDTDNSFTTCPDVLKQQFTSKNYLTGIVSANSPQRNCSVQLCTTILWQLWNWVNSRKPVMCPRWNLWVFGRSWTSRWFFTHHQWWWNHIS